MSRSGYSDEFDSIELALYRGRVASASRGKRGQALFRDILIAMNGMTIKRLVADALETADGAVCAIGAAGRMRGIDMSGLDPEDADQVAAKFNVADCLAREIVWINDEWGKDWKEWSETAEERFLRVRRWLRASIKDPLFDVVWC